MDPTNKNYLAVVLPVVFGSTNSPATGRLANDRNVASLLYQQYRVVDREKRPTNAVGVPHIARHIILPVFAFRPVIGGDDFRVEPTRFDSIINSIERKVTETDIHLQLYRSVAPALERP